MDDSQLANVVQSRKINLLNNRDLNEPVKCDMMLFSCRIILMRINDTRALSQETHITVRDIKGNENRYTENIHSG